MILEGWFFLFSCLIFVGNKVIGALCSIGFLRRCEKGKETSDTCFNFEKLTFFFFHFNIAMIIGVHSVLGSKG